MNSLKGTAFQCVAVPEFPPKPRQRGLTMVIDYGLGLPHQSGLIESAGYFLDMAKFATGLARVMPAEVLKQKIERYQRNGVHSFPGGQFFELAYLQGRAEAYLEEVKAVGFSHVEISENCINLTPEKKAEYIRRAVGAGLNVLGESGSKLQKSTSEHIISDLENCREAGAWKVFVEAAEFITDQGLNMQLVEALTRSVDIGFLIFEIPSQWMKGVTFSTQYEFWKLLMHHIGPDVNLANIPPDELMRLSLMRLGLGADTTLDRGAFVMTQRGVLP